MQCDTDNPLTLRIISLDRCDHAVAEVFYDVLVNHAGIIVKLVPNKSAG